MKKVAWGALLLAAACSSGGGDTPPETAPASVADPQIAQLQTSMTELLERLDVLNDRINRLEAAQPSGAPAPPPARSSGEPAPVTPTPAPSSAVTSARIAEAYRQAIMLFGANRTAESRAAFQKVFDADPHGDLADNALFWIGETYFAANQYGEAMRYYSRVTREYPNENKAPDAMFKMAVAYERTSDLALAKKTLEEVISRYPYSTPAASARAELKRIKY